MKDIYNRIDLDISSMSAKKRSILWLLVISLCFVAILILNLLTPLISDDFAYLYIYGEGTKVSSIGDIIQSQVNHYHQWGGRSVVHFIAQVLLLLPSFIADLLNSFVYLGYIFLIYYHIKGKGEHSLSLFVLINLAVWFMQPVIGDTILWITGSANYLWGTALILLFLLPYRLYNGNEISKLTQVIASSGLFFYGIIAGWTNENTAGAMILIAIVFVLYFRRQNWRIPVWSVSGLAGCLIGFGIMILAPGNFERAGDGSSVSLYIIAYRLFECTRMLFYYCAPVIVSGGIIYVLYHHFNREEKRGNAIISYIYCIAAIAAVYAMVLSPTFPRRALFGIVTYLIIGFGVMVYNLDFRQSFLRRMRCVVVVVGLACMAFTYYMACKDINMYRQITDERIEKIEEAKEKGLESIEFERFDGSQYIHGEDPFSEVLMSRYYGIEIKLYAP